MRDPLHRTSVRAKLVLMFVSVSLIAYGLGGMLVSRWAEGALEREILSRLAFQCRAWAGALDARLGLLARRAEDFASDGLIRESTTRLVDGEAGAEAVRAALRRHLTVNKLPLEPGFRDLAVTDADGNVLVAVRDGEVFGQPGSGLAGRLAAGGEGGLTDGLRVSGLVEPRDEAEGPGLVLSTPLRDIDAARVVGRLAVFVSARDWLVAAGAVAGGLEPLPGESRADLVLHDRSGRGLVASLDASGALGPLRLAGPGASGAGDGPIAPRGSFAREFPLSEGGWSTEVTLDSEAAVRPVTSLRSSFMGIGLVLAGLSLGLLFFPMRFLARPLSELTGAALRLREGHFSTRVPVESSDEIGALASAFNGMAEAIQERTERLEAAATELRARQEELRAGRDRLSAVISSMQDALVVLDGSGKVVLSNAAAAPLLGLVARREPALAHHVCREATPEDPGACFACLFDARAPARSCLVDVGARTFEIHTTALPPAAGGGGGRVLVSREVTDRIQRDERDIHNERLAVLGEVAAVMAHEINNPLASISLFNQMLAAELPEGSPLRENTEVIRRNIDTAKHAIHALLDYATGASPEVGPTDVHDTLADVLRFLRPLGERAGVTLRLDAEAKGSVVTGDEVQLRQVFVNLALNAIQAVAGRSLVPGAPGAKAAAHDPSGPPRQVVLSTRDEGGRLVVDVTDTGPGIAPGDRERIFRPFFTTKSRGEGTGLGLPTARRLAEMQGGSLELVESSVAGTTFRVSLRPRSEPVTAAGGAGREA